MRRRTYRAHGRINGASYFDRPCEILHNFVMAVMRSSIQSRCHLKLLKILIYGCVSDHVIQSLFSLSDSFSFKLIVLAYMSCPAHIELIAEERNDEIVKEKDEKLVKQSKKQVAQARAKTIKTGGGVN